MKKHALSYLFAALLLGAPFCPANNINVANVTLTGQNTASDYALVQFDLSWENSWRDEFNWDAAWVFVKYQVTGSGVWNHAILNATPGNHTIPGGYACSVGLTDAKGMGAFIYRGAAGSGNTSLTSVKLRWEYGTNGLADGASVTVNVFAIEMVSVAQGAFYLGDADFDQVGSLYTYGTNQPYRVISEDAIIIGQTTGNLWANTNIEASTLPAAFPKGYAAFYCMKYECSEDQWVDFFNTLTDLQKTTLDITSSLNGGKNSDGVVNRNTVSWTSGDATCTRPDRACGYHRWYDVIAYADWAGLRPMTELEYEKACRGTQNVVDDEYAWGTSNSVIATTISGTEDGTETITNAGANMCDCNNPTYTGGDGGRGPLRCGIFAKSATTREQAGASYYGIMELSGSLNDWVVVVHEPTGRSFTGIHGDGSLNSNGYANVTNWPNNYAIGAVVKAWAVCYRMSACGSERGAGSGIRAVRSAP